MFVCLYYVIVLWYYVLRRACVFVAQNLLQMQAQRLREADDKIEALG
jgi:hypothetical protein